MIATTMAVGAAVTGVSARAEHAREARLPRLAALIFDTIVLAALTLVVNSVYGVSQQAQGLLSGPGAYATTVAWPWLTLVAIVYFAVPEAMFGATPGKALTRLCVVRLDGRPLGLGSVIVRNLLKPIDALPLLYLLGGILVAVTPGSRRLGDLAAGTTVVYRVRALEPGATRSSTQSARRALIGAVVIAIILTLAFDYFGRPPLVIAGDFNVHSAPMNDALSYSLGSPQWGLGTVTYPISVERRIGETGRFAMCSGTITLDWGWLGGWNTGQSGWSCG